MIVSKQESSKSKANAKSKAFKKQLQGADELLVSL